MDRLAGIFRAKMVGPIRLTGAFQRGRTDPPFVTGRRTPLRGRFATRTSLRRPRRGVRGKDKALLQNKIYTPARSWGCSPANPRSRASSPPSSSKSPKNGKLAKFTSRSKKPNQLAKHPYQTNRKPSASQPAIRSFYRKKFARPRFRHRLFRKGETCPQVAFRLRSSHEH